MHEGEDSLSADVTNSIEFLTEAAGLAERLLARGRLIFDVRYDGLAFGSWELTAGTSKRRVRATWDGRDATLRVETAEFGDSRSRPEWRTVSEAPGRDHSPSVLLLLAEAIIIKESGIPAA